jgi:hypothetical protein
MSRGYRLLSRGILDNEIGIAPADQTRTRNNMHIRPTQWTFCSAYQVLRLPYLTSKTRETAFQVLNWTVWMKLLTIRHSSQE